MWQTIKKKDKNKFTGVKAINQSLFPYVIPISPQAWKIQTMNIDILTVIFLPNKTFICYSIKLETILAESKQSGIPPPGWTLPPQKYRFKILLEKFGCLKKADILLLLEAPYNDPK